MSRRTIAILILVIGLLMLALVGFFIIQGQNQPVAPAEGEEGVVAPDGEVTVDGTVVAQPPTPLAGDDNDTVGVVVSLQTLPRGHVITEDILAVDMRPRSSIEGNVITQTQDAVGKYARTDIYQGQTLTRDKLANNILQVGEQTIGPSSLIPPGFVAQSVPLAIYRLDNEDGAITSVGYGVSEGDYVDILLLFDMHQIDEQFQTILPNELALLVLVEVEGEGEEGSERRFLEVDPLGRFQELPTGDIAHIRQREFQRPFVVGMILQNAKVIQVGNYVPPVSAASQIATATPTALPEGAPTPTPVPGGGATATPLPPEVFVVALQPQQQLLLRYALEVGADVDFALRGVGDGQLYEVQNVDLDLLLERFNIEIPPDFGYTLDTGFYQVTPTPASGGGGGGNGAPAPNNEEGSDS